MIYVRDKDVLLNFIALLLNSKYLKIVLYSDNLQMSIVLFNFFFV